jgi:hypothetical protein
MEFEKKLFFNHAATTVQLGFIAKTLATGPIYTQKEIYILR